MSATDTQLLRQLHSPNAVGLASVRKVASCGGDLSHGVSGGLGRDPAQRRRVQFADEMGLDLFQVRVMAEPSWVPPQLPPRILLDLQSKHTAAAATDSDPRSRDPGAVQCKFKRRFEQPISKYIMFRENIEKHCICLSSLHFDGCSVSGVVSVKNVCFNKRVFAKVTFNCWQSSQEIAAVYSNSSDGCSQDNFTFSFHCPAMSAFEFCLGFEAIDLGGRSFWDSNGGENYKVVVKKSGGRKSPPKSAAFTGSFKPSFNHVTEFSEYAVWQHHRSDKVYY